MSNLLEKMVGFIAEKIEKAKQSHVEYAASLVHECADSEERIVLEYSSDIRKAELATVTNDITIESVMSRKLEYYYQSYLEEFLSEFYTGQREGKNFVTYYSSLTEQLCDWAVDAKYEASEYVVKNHLFIIKEELAIEGTDEKDIIEEVYEWFNHADHEFHTSDIVQKVYNEVNKYSLIELYEMASKASQ